MEHRKIVEEHVQKREIISHYTCDICKETIDNNKEGYWRYSEVEMYLRVTIDGDSNYETFDICEGCWESVIKPFFEREFGLKPRED